MTNPRGRPSSYTEATAEYICEQLASGRSLTKILQDEGMPGYSTVMRWLSEQDAFRENYTRAREVQVEFLAEQCLEIADGSDDPQKGRLRFDARRWYASKMFPKKYGDRIATEHSGPGGGPITITKIEHVIVDPKNTGS